MGWRSESLFTVVFRAYVGLWFHCSPNTKASSKRGRRRTLSRGTCTGQNRPSGEAHLPWPTMLGSHNGN
ncbi:hypothetical protein FVE88_13485 [Ectopseudomonas mendocina]|nr:hypothetical protein FVE88_13485 [Pseudomonas mendocina]